MGANKDLNFEQLFEALPSPYMVLDAGMKFVAVNGAYERAVMRPRTELLGRNLFDEFPNEGAAGTRLRDSFRQVLESGEPDTIAFLHYDIPRPDDQGGGLERRFWTATHTPVLGGDGRVAYLVQNTVDVTDIVHLREAANLPFHSEETRLLERAREAEEQHKALLSESEDFRRLFQQAPGFFSVLWGPDHVFTFANDAYTKLIGGRSVIGLPLRDAVPEIRDQGFIEMLDRVYRTGEPEAGQAVRVMLASGPDAPLRETFLDFSYDAIRDRDGAISGVFVQGMDTTELVRTAERQRLLLAEINHRVKNTLATVQSIASHTLRSAPDTNVARASLEARLVALSRAHNLLSASQWDSTDLAELIAHELSVYGKDRIRIDGAPFMLRPKASIALTLLIHESSANAAKHGSLSRPGGQVAISWVIGTDENEQQMLTLHWREEGGPPAAPPKYKGFGSRMIERIVTGELGGELKLDYTSTGLDCIISLPTRTLVTERGDVADA